eukprot:339901-Chlamydomonas_euryale.AAC.1
MPSCPTPVCAGCMPAAGAGRCALGTDGGTWVATMPHFTHYDLTASACATRPGDAPASTLHAR